VVSIICRRSATLVLMTAARPASASNARLAARIDLPTGLAGGNKFCT
jgi:hypothetical protein